MDSSRHRRTASISGWCFPGRRVKADTILVQMSNPELQQAAVDAEYQMKAAKGGLRQLEGETRNRAVGPKIHGRDGRALIIGRRNSSWMSIRNWQESGLIADHWRSQLDKVKADSLSTRNEIELNSGWAPTPKMKKRSWRRSKPKSINCGRSTS